MKQIGVCNISDFTSVILKSFLFRHRVRKCISTHNSSHICTYQDVADVKVQCVCVCDSEGVLLCIFPLTLPQADQGILRDCWSEMLGAFVVMVSTL